MSGTVPPSEQAAALWRDGVKAYEAFTSQFATVKVVDANATLFLETAADKLEQLAFLHADQDQGAPTEAQGG